jgi:hypothetical protein
MLDHSLLEDLGISHDRPHVLCCDNIGMTYLSSNPVFHMAKSILKVVIIYEREVTTH